MAGYSGLWDGVHGESYSLSTAKGTNRYHLGRLLRKRGMREISEVLTTLLADSTPASTASIAVSRVAHVADPSSNVLGGVATIESKQLMGSKLESLYQDTGANTARAVTAADVTSLQGLMEGGSEKVRQPGTYPTDASGNGGGGKGEFVG